MRLDQVFDDKPRHLTIKRRFEKLLLPNRV